MAGQRRRPVQQHALGQLRALTTQPRFRVVIDEEGFPYIPGRYGRVEWFDGRDLAVSSDRPRVFVKLWAIPSVHCEIQHRNALTAPKTWSISPSVTLPIASPTPSRPSGTS